MAKPDIVLTRIDDRLIHGQIIGGWGSFMKANLILVANDEIVDNETEKSIMEMTASSMGFETRFFTLDKTIEIIGKASPDQHILLICKTPRDVVKLLDGGVPIDTVNVGNMRVSEGKEKISKKVYVDEEDRKALKYLQSKVKTIFIQDSAYHSKEKLEI